jgi:hypothetical protein
MEWKIKTMTKTPQQKCGQQLMKIAPDVQAEDRRAAMQEFGKSYVTIGRYLKGEVANLVLGINLLSFFKRLIEMRTCRLEELSDG